MKAPVGQHIAQRRALTAAERREALYQAAEAYSETPEGRKNIEEINAWCRGQGLIGGGRDEPGR